MITLIMLLMAAQTATAAPSVSNSSVDVIVYSTCNASANCTGCSVAASYAAGVCQTVEGVLPYPAKSALFTCGRDAVSIETFTNGDCTRFKTATAVTSVMTLPTDTCIPGPYAVRAQCVQATLSADRPVVTASYYADLGTCGGDGSLSSANATDLLLEGSCTASMIASCVGGTVVITRYPTSASCASSSVSWREEVPSGSCVASMDPARAAYVRYQCPPMPKGLICFQPGPWFWVFTFSMFITVSTVTIFIGVFMSVVHYIRIQSLPPIDETIPLSIKRECCPSHRLRCGREGSSSPPNTPFLRINWKPCAVRRSARSLPTRMQSCPL